MLLYLAAPLFSVAERAFNAVLTTDMERVGMDVFLPQRDGVDATRAPYDTTSREQRRRATFLLDREQVFACDVFLVVTDGRVPDEGAAVELGMAHAHRELTGHHRRILALHTDVRRTFAHAALNPMISQALDVVHRSTGDLLNDLREHVEDH